MNVLKFSNKPLLNSQIIEHLGKLRHHSLGSSSHFAVSAIVEIKIENNKYAYVGGVNVEHDGHNRLGVHAEQNAIITAHSLLGGNIKISKIWLMGAPDHLFKGDTDNLVHNFVTPCGHCRQILMGFSSTETQVYSVSVSGVLDDPKLLIHLLPNAFSEQDLYNSSEDNPDKTPTKNTIPYQHSLSSLETRQMPWQYLKSKESYQDTDICSLLSMIKPHIIDRNFLTSSIQTCVLKAENNNVFYYFTGSLVQDIAFMTTDAIFAALAQAITELGEQRLEIKEIHLCSSLIDPSQLTGVELQHLIRFSTAETLIKFYNRDSTSQAFNIFTCIEATSNRLQNALKQTITSQSASFVE